MQLRSTAACECIPERPQVVYASTGVATDQDELFGLALAMETMGVGTGRVTKSTFVGTGTAAARTCVGTTDTEMRSLFVGT